MSAALADEDFYGLSRVLGARGTLPQMAARLDASPTLRAGEILVDVEHLNLDAASFRQLHGQCGGDAARIGRAVTAIVAERGKMHNPVTGSGGVLVGTVRDFDARHPHASRLQRGTRIATLASLSLTPLQLNRVMAVHVEAERIEVRGSAIVFASCPYARVPEDLPGTLALAVLDVCGAPALTAQLVRPGMRVAVLGAGKSGALCLAQARRNLEGRGLLVAADISRPALQSLSAIGLCDCIVAADVTRPLELLSALRACTGGELCDLVINCTTVANAEAATVLATRNGGTALFFSMATDFRAATLGAEGVARDIRLLMGNGYVEGHAELALNLLRGEPRLLDLFSARFAS